MQSLRVDLVVAVVYHRNKVDCFVYVLFQALTILLLL